MNPLFANTPTSIFAAMSTLAVEHGAVNLGQGFPDFGWPDDVVGRAADALLHESNQYAPMLGLPMLREAVATHYRAHQRLEIAPADVTVTSGATEALAAAILALVEPGDEVLLFQPLYDAYLPMVLRAGGVPRFIRLAPPDWRITEAALAAAFTPRTRLVIFNNPHNPSARVFDETELGLLAAACVRHDAVALTDEVWEHVVFDGRTLRPLASLPGMAERTVKVGSAGKIFSLTGWKVGWIVAPPDLAVPISKAHQFLAYATPPNLQAAVGYGLGKDMTTFETMRRTFAASRDDLVARLTAGGFSLLPAEGTYFVCVDLPASGIALDDASFCDRIVRDFRVAAIPLSPFYAEDPVTSIIRLCFAKKPETIAAGADALIAARAALA
ncbi:aminotransferase [Sphingosinicella sp. BN140058]|uniref:aminotransferase n=1 Tax=Sphingosinicella sp. BN140058 TaxID=1892855 RepID=UPI001013C157|nr:aminotransferase [Sphingosinicella sp. BN140058]QAY76005.1 aminotransferase [Sphingosinicella sp. BN140058]